jgi:antibiotic biosynthesis monooxygenase (ABM) superfamily enzyme
VDGMAIVMPVLPTKILAEDTVRPFFRVLSFNIWVHVQKHVVTYYIVSYYIVTCSNLLHSKLLTGSSVYKFVCCTSKCFYWPTSKNIYLLCYLTMLI